jgi:hypothetical protein
MLTRATLVGVVVVLAVAGGAAAAPIFSLPGDLTAEAQSAAGAVVTYDASATNPAGKTIAITCAPASGSTFPLGATTVACTAGDEEGGASATFTVTVLDRVGPVIGGTVSVSLEAVGPSGASAAYETPTAVDAVSGPAPVICEPPSGSTFPVGATPVTCTATDGAGNTSSTVGQVTVVDTTAPTLTVPAPITLGAASGAGLPASDPRVAAFVAAATATDIVTPQPTITTDLPAVLPVGTTTVAFTARDSSGNSASGTSTILVTPAPATGGEPTPPPPPPPPGTQPLAPGPGAADRIPPGNVTGVRATRGSGTVSINWKAPTDSDFSHVRILRSVATEPAASAIAVYEGAATSFRDTRLRNGTQYRYVIVSFDRSGNRSAGVAFAVQPRAILLRAPRDGARVVRPPQLVWSAVKGATYYNVQVFRGKTKVLSAWPTRTRLKLAQSWRYAGRLQRLTAGTYRWYVWPAVGPRRDGAYGEVLGTSAFTVLRS